MHIYSKPNSVFSYQVLDHFKDVEGLKPENICVVGDRVLTDIVFGNLHGMTTVLVKPLR